LNETAADILGYVISEFRERFNSQSTELLTDVPLDLSFPGLTISIPQRGDKKQLIELSQRNTKFYKLDKERQEKIIDPERHTNRILETIKSDFRLKDLPVHMECFDNSNLQGTNAVSACVVFKNAKPSKADYRHFNVQTVEGPDDFATMEEAVFRRYRRLIDEGQTLPQLVIIDGGKGQLSSALTALERLGIRGQMAIVGIAKRLEEIFFPGDSLPIYLDKRSESLKVIQHMRNEAHRFGITHHRNKRSKNAFQSSLADVPGIGPKTYEALMKQFKTVSAIREASQEDLNNAIGKSKASILLDFLQSAEKK
jgi:excinuclease ABC subunit C